MSKSRSNLSFCVSCRLKFYESYVSLSLYPSIFVNFARTVKFRRWKQKNIYFCNFFSIFFFFSMCNVNFQCTKIFCVLYWIFVTKKNWSIYSISWSFISLRYLYLISSRVALHKKYVMDNIFSKKYKIITSFFDFLVVILLYKFFEA